MNNALRRPSATPRQGTGYEVGGIALVKGSRNRDAAKKYCEWLIERWEKEVNALPRRDSVDADLIDRIPRLLVLACRQCPTA